MRSFRSCAFLAVLSFACSNVGFVSAAEAIKRPFSHRDFDGWRTITGQTLSRDGRFLATLTCRWKVTATSSCEISTPVATNAFPSAPCPRPLFQAPKQTPNDPRLDGPSTW